MKYLYVECECGAHLVERVAPEFERVVGLPSGTTVAAAEFVAWVRGIGERELPTLYRVWLHRYDGKGRMGRAVYFEAGGAEYSVFASDSPVITARRLPAGWLREKLLPAERQSTGYAQGVIPRLEEMPSVWLRAADEEGDMAMSAEGFEAVFAGSGSGVELEAAGFAEVFGGTLRELEGAAVHARGCGRGVRVGRL